MKSKITHQLYLLALENLSNQLYRTTNVGLNHGKKQKVLTNPFNTNTVLNQFLQMKLANIQKKKYKSNSELTAVPLNPNRNTLSLGTEMYDSLFTFTVDTPQVWYDPLVWNIIYAALPSDCTIPDLQFLNILHTASANDF